MPRFPSAVAKNRASRRRQGRRSLYEQAVNQERIESRSTSRDDELFEGINLKRLCQAMRRSRRVLEYFREERRRATIQYVGRHWSSGGSNRIVPVNLIARYITTVSRNLISKNPRVMLSTMRQDMRPAVDAMQSWVNQKFVDDYFSETLARFVTDALMCVGIMKVAVASPESASIDNYSEEVGEPFAEVIDLDDFVCDIAATSWKDVRFVGHRFRIPYEDAIAMGYFDSESRRSLAPDDTGPYNEEGDEKISTLGRGYETDGTEDYKEMVTLWEIYLPGEKKIITLPGDSTGVPKEGVKPLKVQEWIGPKCGPYHFLGFGIVPGNLMPKAPVMDLIDLHMLINRLWRKTGDQAERQKTLLLASGTQIDDAGRVTGESDGGVVPCDDPNAAKEFSYGGPHPGVVTFNTFAMQTFNSQAGNLDLLNGSGPQSKTATQDTMLNQNASAGVSDMQETTVASVARITAALLELWWYHPTKVMTSVKSIPGLPEMDMRRDLYPAGTGQSLSRRGSFAELQVRIDPYSMRYRSPQERMAFIMGIVEKHMPAFPMLQQAGVFFDWQEYFKILATYGDEPDIVRLFTVQEPMPVSGGNAGGGGEMGGMPQSTPREYIRRSVGQNTQANQSADVMNEFAKQAAEGGDE